MDPAIQQDRRDSLIVEYQQYVHYVVGYLIDSMNLPPQFHDDFVSAGYLGLVEAAERFDFDSGRPFKNFAFLRIRGAVIDSIRDSSDLTGKAYRYAKALRAADAMRDEILAGTESAPSSPDQKLGSVLDYAAKSIMAFRLTLSECEDRLSTGGNFGEDPEVQLEQKQRSEKFRALIATLPPKERLVIEEYYFNDKSFVQIAQENAGLSKSWVSRLHVRALERLHQSCSAAGLEQEPS